MSEFILKDTSCISSPTPGVYAYRRQVVAQRLFHRLDTRKGELRWSPGELSFGIKLSDEIGRALTQWQENALPDLVRNELSQDRAVFSVSVNMRVETNAGTKTLFFSIVAITTEGQLELNVAADTAGITFLGVA